MSEYNATVSATFMVVAEDLEPELVTKAVGIFPSRSWRVGEHADVRKVSGEPMATARPAEWGCWKAFVPTHLENEPLERLLEHWQVLLTPRKSYLAELSERGWELVIDCYLATATTELVELPAATLRAFGEIGVGIDIHFFSDAAKPLEEEPAF